MMNTVKSEDGVSLLELAIMLPVIMLLISGMIDMGFAINRVKSVVSASRQAARVAASHSKFLAAPVECGTPIASNCAQLAAMNTPPSVTEIAASAACQYIDNNAPPQENWDVDIPQPQQIAEDGVIFSTSSVRITYVGRRCFVCIHELFGSFEPTSSSSFVLEGVCR